MTEVTHKEMMALKLFKGGYWTEIEGSYPENCTIRGLINKGLIESTVTAWGGVKYKITNLGANRIKEIGV